MLTGGGANTAQDRGSLQSSAVFSRNPYFNNNFYARWQEWVRWYYTSWEARKLVDIPIQDAFRIPVKIKNLDDDVVEALEKEAKRLQVTQKMKRGATIERLLGGCVVLMGIRSQEDKPEEPLDITKIEKGDLKFLNVISTEKISKAEYNQDVFSPEYDSPEFYTINGQKTHVSRLIVFDGEPLFSRASMNILQNFRYNPAGFGESVLTTLFDSLIRATGTQEGAYHLVNLASVLLVKCEKLLELETTKAGNKSLDQLNKIAEQLSIYRGAVIEGRGVEIAQHSASFGSVPELLMIYLQIISAGSDIPATRFLGEAPGGLNATGVSDLENYYNNIDSYQTTRLAPKYNKLYQVMGASLYGYKEWENKSQKIDFEYEPLWNISKLDQASVNKTEIEIITSLVEASMMTREQAIDEINQKKILDIELKEEDLPPEPEFVTDPSIPSLRDNTAGLADKIGAMSNVNSGIEPKA